MQTKNETLKEHSVLTLKYVQKIIEEIWENNKFCKLQKPTRIFKENGFYYWYQNEPMEIVDFSKENQLEILIKYIQSYKGKISQEKKSNQWKASIQGKKMKIEKIMPNKIEAIFQIIEMQIENNN